MIRRFFFLGLTVAALVASPMSASAISVEGNVRDVPYVLGFSPINSQNQPYVGQLRLNFNNGIISGSYTDLSIIPGGPFANAHNIPVSGGTSNGHVRLTIRNVTFRGTIEGEAMGGSTTIGGAIFAWAAQQGTPGSGRHQ